MLPSTKGSQSKGSSRAVGLSLDLPQPQGEEVVLQIYPVRRVEEESQETPIEGSVLSRPPVPALLPLLLLRPSGGERRELSLGNKSSSGGMPTGARRGTWEKPVGNNSS